jgi:hypothetical protein
VLAVGIVRNRIIENVGVVLAHVVYLLRTRFIDVVSLSETFQTVSWSVAREIGWRTSSL